MGEMSLYSASRGVSMDRGLEVLVSMIKDKIRDRYLGRHMDYLADSIAKLSQGRVNCLL